MISTISRASDAIRRHNAGRQSVVRRAIWKGTLPEVVGRHADEEDHRSGRVNVLFDPIGPRPQHSPIRYHPFDLDVGRRPLARRSQSTMKRRFSRSSKPQFVQLY